ncbi:hypothetical protein PhCBS80983_g05291 [Powellomyces hirtus]|uniref:Uncharacterized protein n=1 Tax=Powellomyces hirtus TaxID=109895 RepID=A0A507DW90_9FUNG|nr:hypothetical protein PhCBS80983_g05291 [Powellomyces hirtus]
MSFNAAAFVARGPSTVPVPATSTSRYPRTNVLQLPQIHKELASLQQALDKTRASIQKEDKCLIEAQRAAIHEMEQTAVEEVQVLEGVELDKAEEEQVVLLKGARYDLERFEHVAHNEQPYDQQQQQQPEQQQFDQQEQDRRPPRIAGRAAEQTDDPILQQTSDMYRTSGHMPHRFNKPALWRYEIQREHPLYSTTSNDYGKIHPSVHEMPTGFHGQSSKFTKHTNQAGPYRNFSLNTA